MKRDRLGMTLTSLSFSFSISGTCVRPYEWLVARSYFHYNAEGTRGWMETEVIHLSTATRMIKTVSIHFHGGEKKGAGRTGSDDDDDDCRERLMQEYFFRKWEAAARHRRDLTLLNLAL